jgi:hypothetical protein
MTVLALAVMLGVGAAAGFVLGRPGFGIGSALIIWFVLVLPALVVGQQRDTRLSLKLFFTMFRGGQGGP